jgi:TM2 domain-containing membrane protein YozV
LAFCSNCGAETSGNFCNRCGHGQGLQVRQVAVVRTNEKHGIPALLSFFIPGLGQLIKGHVMKGIIVFVGTAISLATIGFGVGVFTTPIVWVWQIYDAYTSN